MRAYLLILMAIPMLSFGSPCLSALYIYSTAAALQDSNHGISRGRFDVASLISRGILAIDPAPVHPMREGVPDLAQTTGFRRVRLPIAKTGFLIPEEADLSNPNSIDGYDGYAIVMPGIGTDRSDAMSLITIGQELKSGKLLKSSLTQRKLKLLPVLLDATLSGMADKAPLYFGEPHFAISVIEHVHLIMKNAFPNAPCVLMGRSQGGLYAMEYAQRKNGVAAVIAMSPSPTRQDLHNESMRIGDENLATMMDTPLTLNRSDISYRRDTPYFASFGIHTPWQRFERWLFGDKEREVPLLIVLGAQDQSYSPAYYDFVRGFVAERSYRELEIFEEGGHDLWSRRNRKLLRSVMERQAEFLEKALRLN